MERKRECLAAVVVVLLFGSWALADVKPAPLFKDNMVLQRMMKVPVWGTADPGEDVTVTFKDQKLAAKADDKGDWKVLLAAMDAGGPFEMTIAGKNTLTLKNVLVGEVWLCSGQSNMEFAVRSGLNVQEEVAAADYPNIRLFNVQNVVAENPAKTVGGQWAVCSPTTVPTWSAVGYFFGRDIFKELNVPIGLIQSDWGGTPAEAWTSKEAMEAAPALKTLLAPWANIAEKSAAEKKKYDDAMALWQKEAAKAKEEGKPEPRKPSQPQGPLSPSRPAGLYNGMIAPLVPYAMRGAIWYQGEANASRAMQYRKLLPAMITCWREKWGEGDFPFGIVSLANFMAVKPDPADSAWAELREAQAITAANVLNCGLALAIDVGDAKDIHPKDKQTVGHRLALWAMATVYGKKVEFSGPVYDSMKVDGNKIVLTLKHVGGGLEAKGGELKGFAIAGDDRKFVWADAKIVGDTVVVSSDKVEKPAAVRYAWADNPICNLYNKDGLPAVPFRTDRP